VKHIFIFWQSGLSLSFLMKAERNEYRQYQFPLRKGNTLNVTHLNRPELYILHTITVCTHTTDYHWEVTEISTVALWRLRQKDLHNTKFIGINLRDEKDQTMLADKVSQIGCTVNVVEGNESELATATKNTK
jgi:hypothetical protein